MNLFCALAEYCTAQGRTHVSRKGKERRYGYFTELANRKIGLVENVGVNMSLLGSNWRFEIEASIHDLSSLINDGKIAYEAANDNHPNGGSLYLIANRFLAMPNRGLLYGDSNAFWNDMVVFKMYRDEWCA
jgi:hypothetical protein